MPWLVMFGPRPFQLISNRYERRDRHHQQAKKCLCKTRFQISELLARQAAQMGEVEFRSS